MQLFIICLLGFIALSYLAFLLLANAIEHKLSKLYFRFSRETLHQVQDVINQELDRKRAELVEKLNNHEQLADNFMSYFEGFVENAYKDYRALERLYKHYPEALAIQPLSFWLNISELSYYQALKLLTDSSFAETIREDFNQKLLTKARSL